ncbi:hypothetical protein JAAARDRAFT_715045 [Jaapia argillacea MUCL 33604]|uniref:Uncharacterized protein n=1 Tax=Jaapia argillacea MUCL 33604 TaxID=933084 RepID=A0A067Q5T0_9AGAM|nr:hypothetical protein JAAARDRAFT_715045 [Jaapia argillacea MUCL 33604]
MSTCIDINNCRTLWSIVHGCLATVFTCTWVAIHPNLPGPDESTFQIYFRRLGIMIMAIFAPELLFLCALKQWVVARRVAKEHKDRDWTTTHGFFALMGGFMLVDRERKPVRVVLPTDLQPDDDMPIEFPQITEGEIQDKSKAGTISNLLIILQTSWFVLQCLARWYQHLAVTELEIITLAFTVVNFLTYFLWWSKPADVCYPHPIRSIVDTTDDDSEGDEEMGNDDSESDEEMGNDNAEHDEEMGNVAGRDPRDNSGFVSWSSQMWQQTRVPTFYAGAFSDQEKVIIPCVFALVATGFGAIHFLAWSLQFPSLSQQRVWRYSAVIITATPCCEITCAIALQALQDIKGMYLWRVLLSAATGIISASATGTYLVLRVYLLYLSVTSLRSLPPGAYEAVDWTKFIPHV